MSQDPGDLVELRTSVRRDGIHRKIHVADVHGRFTTARYVVFVVLIAIYLALPWIPVGGHPAVFLDLETRHFYLMGMTFNAQDTWLMTFLLTGGAFTLVYATALMGRVWCGWACPQTVFLDGVFRRIERLLEGPREKRIRRDAGPMTLNKLARKTVKQVLFVAVSAALAHVFLSYFVSLPKLFEMMRRSPGEHPEAFGVVMFLTGVMYFNFAWFREQFCVVLCPYGRLQSVLLDRDSLIIGYDRARGEPRGKGKDRAGKGDCVDCDRCVAVCPTGIDIRNGLQLDCVACAACIDACDDVMHRVGKPRGLIRYASENSIEGGKTKVLRPRVFLYTGLMLVGAVVAFLAFRERPTVEANLLRLPGPPFALDGEVIRNSFEVHLVNKRAEATTFHVEPDLPDGMNVVVPVQEVTLEPLGQVRLPVFASLPRGKWTGAAQVQIRFMAGGRVAARAAAPFLGP